ncbi:MAG: integration host factor subunit beta [Candidatus Marinimicrobia bacterium]|nr:integration host factor subunit beta [Candidatus Neomarinimicrobiota bacterium]
MLVKSEIIKKLKEAHPNLKRSQIEDIFNIIFDSIKSNLVKNRSVEIRNFGRYSIKNIKAKHNARNPKTNEVIYVPARKKVTFKMSKFLKEEINKKE